MKEILNKVEQIEKHIVKWDLVHADITVKFDDVDFNELVELSNQENFPFTPTVTQLGTVFSGTWDVNDNLTVVLSTKFLPKKG